MIYTSIRLFRLDIIAVTDHNSAENLAPVLELGRKRQIIVVPGMEVETAEEVHAVTLFPDLKHALQVQKIVYDHLSEIKNREDIFGEQRILNASAGLSPFSLQPQRCPSKMFSA